MPVGIIYSLVGLICLYWVDKYNVFKRRTIKDYISMELSKNIKNFNSYNNNSYIYI